MSFIRSTGAARAAAAAHTASAAALAVLLAACGGGDSPAPSAHPRTNAQALAAAPAIAPAPQANGALIESPIAIFPGRGELRAVQRLQRFTVAEFTAAVAVPGVRVAGVTPLYDVQAYRLNYLTVDGANNPIVASGLVALPIKPAGRRAPVLSYQHGTIFKDVEAPTNAMKPDEPPLVFASLGYIVLAADYVGYGASKGAPHPYLLSAPAAGAVNDLITAARLWRQRADFPGPTANGQLFLAGYSEGGYATAAAHRELQQQGAAGPHFQTLVMSLAGGGPQDVGMTLDRQLARVKDENRLLGSLINPGFLRALGNTLREEVRRQMLKLIIPDDADVSFQSTFLDFFLADDIGNINRHCNVLDWAPAVPYELFHGRDDRTVSFVSSQNAQAFAIAAGAAPALVPLTECAASPSDHLPCVSKFFQFAVARMATVARDLP